MQQWVSDQIEEWKEKKKSPRRPLDEYGKIKVKRNICLVHKMKPIIYKNC